MFLFDFWITFVRIILDVLYRQFGRENKKTKAKKNDNIVATSM